MERSSTRKAVFAALPAALLFVTGAASAQVPSLASAVDAAIQTNPEIRAAAERRTGSQAALGVSQSGLLPRVDLNAAAARQRLDTPQSRALGFENATISDRAAGLTVSQMLFDGYATRSEIARDEARLGGAESRLVATIDDVALRTVAAYVEVARRHRSIEVATDNLAAHERLRDQIRQRTDSGVGRRIDLEQAEGRVALAQINLQAEQQALRDAQQAYRRLVGQLPGAVSLPPATAIDGSLETALLSDSLGGFVDRHPLVRTAAADVDAARADYQATRAPRMPRLDLEVSTTRERNPIIDRSHDTSAFLRLRWNLFRGFADDARSVQAAAAIEENREQVQRVRLQVQEELATALNAVRSLRDRQAALSAHVAASDSTRRAYAAQFEIGQRTLLDLLNAENEYFGARLNLLAADSARIAATYRVRAALGELLGALNLAAPGRTAIANPASPNGTAR